MADPLDKQLVEAVLSRPRRGRADLEEAKLASLRPARTAVAVVVEDDDDDDDDLSASEPDALADAAELGVEVAPVAPLVPTHEGQRTAPLRLPSHGRHCRGRGRRAPDRTRARASDHQ